MVLRRFLAIFSKFSQQIFGLTGQGDILLDGEGSQSSGYADDFWLSGETQDGVCIVVSVCLSVCVLQGTEMNIPSNPSFDRVSFMIIPLFVDCSFQWNMT